MYRHTLLALLFALMLAPSLAQAQAAEPVGTVSTGEGEVARGYDNPNAYFEVTIGVMVIGTIHDTEEQASRSARTIANIFSAALTSDPGEDFEFGDMEEMEPSALGDEAFAHRMPFTMFGSFEGQYVILSIRQESWVQVTVGFGIGDVDVLGDLEAIAGTTLSRWPTDDPIAVREDGLRTGGIWNMTPMPEDMPAGYVLDEDFEEGPGATVSDIVPVGTPEPAATPETPEPDLAGTPEPDATEPAATPEATAIPEQPTVADDEATEESRDLPLIPTDVPEMPEADEPVEDPATPVPSAELPSDIATPDGMNPRLALPFDVKVEVIMPLDNATIAEDGSCSGAGLLDGLTGDATLTLRTGQDGSLVATAPVSGPGIVAYDTIEREEVCYFSASFTDVPPRAHYTLLAGESVLGRLTYEELHTGQPVLVVIGGD